VALPLPLVMHRLDVPVSGLCVVAKTRRAALDLARQFEQREVQKVYHAVLVGRLPRLTSPVRTQRIEEPIGGLSASTDVDVLEVTPHVQWGWLTTVRMMPHTGRTHQLRLHAARALGCPILGDDLYWDAAAEVRR